MGEAAELMAARNGILLALDPTDIPRINFRAIAAAAAAAIDRGWTGNEVARHATQGVYTGEAENLGALLVANIRELAQHDPPRVTTPSPPPIAEVNAWLHKGHAPSANPGDWATKIRKGAR